MRTLDKTYYPIQLCIIHHKAIVWDFHEYIASAPRNPDGCGLYDHWSDIAKYSFRLDRLPDTNGKTVDLTLEWNSFSGKKTAKFKYRSRQEARIE